MCVGLRRFAGFRQYKAALHVHTSNSDGQQTLADVIEKHYELGYDILAITDHGYLTRDWASATNGLTPARLAEIEAGVGRGGRGMLMIPDTEEQSSHEHVNTFFLNYTAPYIAGVDVAHDPHFVSYGHPMQYGMPRAYTLEDLKRTLQVTQDEDGLSHINHPGRYTGAGLSPYPVYPSNDPANINKYAGLFMDYSTCIGISIINKKDDESRNDRILWDNINKETIPQGRLVCGFSNDDTHYNDATGFAFNVMLMPTLTLAAFRAAMRAGRFYAVSRVAIGEGLPWTNDRTSQTPVIRDIVVGQRTIQITAENHTRIDWIGERSERIAGSDTFFLPRANIGSFIRANVIGPHGIAFTQPWRIWPNGSFFEQST